MKSRAYFLAFLCIGVTAVSCETLPELEPFAPTTQALEVAAAPSEGASDAPPANAAKGWVLERLKARHTGLSQQELPVLAATIEREAERHRLDPALVMAVIEVESGYYHRAVSVVGALGLMQLLPSTAEELAQKHDLPWHGPESLFDPVLNVMLGTAYLRELDDNFGNMDTALAAYNWGPGRIKGRLRKGAHLPVRYVNRVMRSYEASEELRSSES